MAFIVLGASNTRLRCTRPHPPIVSPPIILSSKLLFALSLSSGEFLIFIGPESDHWQCLSLTESVTHSCLVYLIDVTLACEDANSTSLVEFVTIADVDAKILVVVLKFG